MTNEELLAIIEKAAQDKQTQLELRECGITSLPPEIGKLTSLTRIYLNGNKLETLPPEIGQLTNLTRLYLRDNKITCLPPEIKNLTKLTHIYIRGNKLTGLPPQIGNLTELKGLFLSDNNIATLPPEIANLTKLSNLDLTRNPIEIPPDILNNVNEPGLIIQYYLKYQSEAAESAPELLNEVKMLLLGVAGAGKSSLVARLLNKELASDSEPTRGINRHSWQLPLEDRQVKVNIWDFGGAAKMYFAHQFFLSDRSIYLLVADASKTQAENELESWLELIKSFGGNSPVIVVGNKVDRQPLNLNRGELAKQYPNIKTFVEVSCETNSGISELKTIIAREIAALPHNVFQELDPTWASVKKRLETNFEPTLALSDYHALARGEAMVEESDRLELLKLLNDLGIIFYLGKDPRLQDDTIYQSELLVDGIYTIINDSELNEYQGVLEAEQFERIFADLPQLQANSFLIAEAMHKMNLALEVEARQMYIILDLLGQEAVITGDWQDADSFEYRYRVKPPSSIISRFLIAMQKYIYENYYWRNGVILATEDNKALVKFDRDGKKVSIWVNGQAETRAKLLKQICDRFYLIHKTIPQIEVEEVSGGAGQFSEFEPEQTAELPDSPTLISVSEQDPTFILDEVEEIEEDLPPVRDPFDPDRPTAGQESTFIIDASENRQELEEKAPVFEELPTEDLGFGELEPAKPTPTPAEESETSQSLAENEPEEVSLGKVELESDSEVPQAESQDKPPMQPISTVIPDPPKLDFTPVEEEETFSKIASEANSTKKGPNLVLISAIALIVVGVAIGSFVYISQSNRQQQSPEEIFPQ